MILQSRYYCSRLVQKRKSALFVVIVTDKVYLLPVKEKIIEKLIKIKGLNKNNITSLGNNYEIVEDSLKELKQTLDSIREKIPRMGNQINKIELKKGHNYGIIRP